MRVGTRLARGIFGAALVLAGGRLSSSDIRPVDRALSRVQEQSFAPLVQMAVERLRSHFSPDREERFFRELFGLSGKWKALFRTRDSYERFVRHSFEKHVWPAAAPEDVLSQIRSDYDYALRASENRLLVSLYQDVRPPRPELTFESFRMEYYRLADRLAPYVLKDLAMNGVSIAASEAAAMVFTAALTSSGLLGGTAAAGGAGGAASLGIGLVVALAVGLTVDATVGEAFESAARSEIHVQVNALRNRLIEDVTEALVEALEAHRRLQEECILSLYSGGSHDLGAPGR